MTNPVLLPLVAAQGLWVRSRVEVLPEAAGPTTGSVDGPAPPLRVLVIGESTAAGCGAPTHEEGFAGAFARELARVRRRAVDWEVHARNGATISVVRRSLLPADSTGVDVAVLLVGVNDVLRRTPVDRWRADLSTVLEALGARADQVLLAGVPPFDAFPSLPRTLGRYLAARGRALDDVAQDVCSAQPSARWVASTDITPAEPAYFARDGFHPSPVGYEHWARAIVEIAFG